MIKAAYRRIAERRGRNIAKAAAARKLLTLVYYGLRDGEVRVDVEVVADSVVDNADRDPLMLPRPCLVGSAGSRPGHRQSWRGILTNQPFS